MKFNAEILYTIHLFYRLGDMRVDDCRFFDSKMRPLLLVYDNPDTSSVLKDVRIMFKNGDGQYSHAHAEHYTIHNTVHVYTAARCSSALEFNIILKAVN